MKILIAGDGKVGSILTKQLTMEGHDITVIDSKQEVLDHSQERYDVMAIRGNCASMDILRQAGAEDADLLIAVTNEDEINLLCCMTGHALNNNIHTIARIRNPEYREQIYNMRSLFGLSLTVNPERQAAREIEHLLKFPGFLKRETFAKGRVELVELKIEAGSILCNLPLSDLYSRLRCKILVCTVLRKGQVYVPDGRFVLCEGDRIFMSSSSDQITELLKNLGILTHKVKSVIVCGGGRIGYYLAAELIKSKIAVKIIERDHEACLKMASMLPEAEVIEGDASNQYLLESEGIDKCDALVTLTGMDEQNVLISLFGSIKKVPQIITKIGHMETDELIESLSIGSIISPKSLCGNKITQYVRALQNQAGSAESIHSIADGHAEALEFIVTKDTKNCGVALKNLNFHKNTLVACIVHQGLTEVASGDSKYYPGDTVIVVSTGDRVIYKLSDVFVNYASEAGR